MATLRLAGIEPVVIVSGVDESVLDGLAPSELAGGLAELKCRAVLDHLSENDDVAAQIGTPGVVLGCDSVLEFDGEALGKPHTPEVAVARWQAMRGRSGVLHTGHALADLATGRMVTATRSTTVHFAEITDAEIEAYVATGEPLHVAGAFTIDGFGGAFIERIEGDHHNVIGVSLPALRSLVIALGHAWPSLWNRA